MAPYPASRNNPCGLDLGSSISVRDVLAEAFWPIAERLIAAGLAARLLLLAVIVRSHSTDDRQNLDVVPSGFTIPQPLDRQIIGMKFILKIAVVAVWMVTAIWTISYWDAREADVACDISQAPSHVCQGGFVKASRFKYVLETNEFRDGEGGVSEPR